MASDLFKVVAKRLNIRGKNSPKVLNRVRVHKGYEESFWSTLIHRARPRCKKNNKRTNTSVDFECFSAINLCKCRSPEIAFFFDDCLVFSCVDMGHWSI